VPLTAFFLCWHGPLLGSGRGYRFRHRVSTVTFPFHWLVVQLDALSLVYKRYIVGMGHATWLLPRAKLFASAGDAAGGQRVCEV
jgi:hypothetical protein